MQHVLNYTLDPTTSAPPCQTLRPRFRRTASTAAVTVTKEGSVASDGRNSEYDADLFVSIACLIFTLSINILYRVILNTYFICCLLSQVKVRDTITRTSDSLEMIPLSQLWGFTRLLYFFLSDMSWAITINKS